MPPKTPNKTGEGVALSQADLEFTVVVLKRVGAMEVDWRGVAAEVGINRHDNATKRFNGILSKLGCKLIKGKVISLDDDAAAAATPSKPAKAPAKAKTPGTGRKRKAKDDALAKDAVDADEDGVQAKKKVKTEEDNDETNGKGDVKAKAE